MDEPSEALGYAEKALRFDPKHATRHQDVVDISGKLTAFHLPFTFGTTVRIYKGIP